MKPTPERSPRPRRRFNDEPEAPRLIGGSVEDYLRSQGLATTNTLARVLLVWHAVVGEEIATHAIPTAVTQEELVVAVDHPTWATELRLLSSRILSELEMQLEMPIAARIKVQVRA